MNKIKNKFIDQFILWLDQANSNRTLNIALMSIIILSVIVFFMFTIPDSFARVQILLIPIIAGLDIYFLYSKNHFILETANFVAGLLFIGFIFFSLTLIFMGLVILKSL